MVNVQGVGELSATGEERRDGESRSPGASSFF